MPEAKKVFDHIKYHFSVFLDLFLKGNEGSVHAQNAFEWFLIFGGVDCLPTRLHSLSFFLEKRKYLLRIKCLLA